MNPNDFIIQPVLKIIIDGKPVDSLTPISEIRSSSTYDLEGAAKYLGMTTRKVREFVKLKKIACTRPDYRTYIFTQADLDEFLSAYRSKPKRI